MIAATAAPVETEPSHVKSAKFSNLKLIRIPRAMILNIKPSIKIPSIILSSINKNERGRAPFHF